MANKKNKNRYTDLLEYLKANMNLESNITIHKEVSAWTTAGLYFTFIIILYNIISNSSIDKNIFKCIDFHWICCFIIIFLLLILTLIHAQYGSHQNGRAINDTYSYYIYKIMNDEKEIKERDWKMSKNRIFPIFLKNEIDKRSSKYHKFYNIFPFISIIWLIMKVISLIYFFIISVKAYLSKWIKTKKRKWKYLYKDLFVIDKINLIESSIYSILILHTAAFLIWAHKILK